MFLATPNNKSKPVKGMTDKLIIKNRSGQAVPFVLVTRDGRNAQYTAPSEEKGILNTRLEVDLEYARHGTFKLSGGQPLDVVFINSQSKKRILLGDKVKNARECLYGTTEFQIKDTTNQVILEKSSR